MSFGPSSFCYHTTNTEKGKRKDMRFSIKVGFSFQQNASVSNLYIRCLTPQIPGAHISQYHNGGSPAETGLKRDNKKCNHLTVKGERERRKQVLTLVLQNFKC